MRQHVVALRVDRRCEFAPRVQELLTHAGCRIEARLGLHSPDLDDDQGLILLVVRGEPGLRDNLCAALAAVPGVRVNCMAAPD